MKQNLKISGKTSDIAYTIAETKDAVKYSDGD